MNDGSGQSSSANTKQIMRLMDSLKTLGDENAALLREVEELEAARAEAKAARDSMRKFKNEYGKRFTSLKKALEKFRQEHPNGNTNSSNPVNNSDFMRSASVSDQMQRQEQLIRKLTADLKKEKDESKKKDAALRKYESFYREVKARSAQKAAQRQMESQQQQQRRQTPRVGNPPRSTHR
jgi:chromosome segregation ATPase